MFVATDLHGHTRFSDGRCTPEEYVDFRRELGIKVIAVSDHDTLCGVRRAAAAASQCCMLLIPAAEMTSSIHFGTSAAEQIHVLAYYPADVLVGRRLEQTFFFQRGQRMAAKWKAFVLAWLASLSVDDQRKIDPDDDLEALTTLGFPAQQCMIDRIAAHHWAMLDPFRTHLADLWSRDQELFGWSPEDLMDAIRGDGAIDIVAHPACYRDKGRTARVVERASGLEVYTSRHTSDVAARYREYATAKRKLWTASADDHQNARYVRPPCGTPVATIERILQKPLPTGLILAA